MDRADGDVVDQGDGSDRRRGETPSGPGAVDGPARRSLLGAIAVTGAGGLAGCSTSAIPGLGGSDDDAEPSPTCEGEVTIDVGDDGGDGGDGGNDGTAFYASAGHTGYVTSPGPTALERTWRVTPDDREQWGLHPDRGLWAFGIPPLVVDGTLYAGGHSGIFAVDAATGEHRWTVDVRVTREDSLLLADGTIVGVLADDEDDPVGLVGVDPASRTEIWEHRHAVDSSPLATDGTVYSITDRGLLPLDPATGDGLAEPFGADHGLSAGVPTLRDGTVYATEGDTVTAVDAENGELLWSERIDLSTGDDGGSFRLWRPAVSESAVYVPVEYSPPREPSGPGGAPDGTVYQEKLSDGNDVLYALDPESGDRQWSYHFDGAIETRGPVVAGDVVFVHGLRDARLHTEGSSEGFVVAIDAVEGCRIWEATPFEGERYPMTGMAGAGESLYFEVRGPDDLEPHRLYVIDVTDGTVRDSLDLPDVESPTTSVVAGGRVYLTVEIDGEEELWALAEPSG